MAEHQSPPVGRDGSTITVGLLASGALSYVFLVLPARSGRLDPVTYGPLAALWFAVFTVGSGLFVPLEQELTRAVADARSEEDSRAQLRAAALVGLCIGVVIVVAALAFRTVMVERILAGESDMFWVFLATLPGFLAFELARGMLAGTRCFGWYGALLVGDAMLRVVVAAVAVIAGSVVVWHYGIAVAVGMTGAAIIGLGAVGWGPTWSGGLRSASLIASSRRVSPVSTFARRFAPFAASQLLAQVAMNSPVLLAAALATAQDDDAVGRIGSTLVLVRTPLYLLPALTAPVLARMAAGSFETRTFDRLLLVVLVLTLAAAPLAGLVGPPVSTVLFGEGFALDGLTVGLLTAGAGGFALASLLTVDLLARGRSLAILVSWIVGLGVAIGFALTIDDLVRSVAVAFVVATGVASAWQFGSIRWQRRTVQR